MRNFAVSSPLLVSLVLSACGSGGGGSGSGEEITIAYVDNKITNEMPPPGSYTATGTVLVCDDGYQGNSIDIGRVILSKINSSSTGETLALAFSYKLSATPADGTFTAFYIDTDNQPATGKAVTGSDGVAIGADVLFLDQHSFDPSGSSTVIASDFYTWSGTSWVAQTSSYGTGSYYHGLSINKAVFASNSVGVPGLLGTMGAWGVFTVQYLPGGDPNNVVSTLDSTTSCTFDIPS